MGKVWVLDTETKGTGAQMVPIEKVLTAPRPARPVHVLPKRRPRRVEASEPRRPRRFRVVDAMTQQVLAERGDARATVNLLEGVRSIIDVSVYVWQPKSETWRMLSIGEKKVLRSAALARPADSVEPPQRD